MNTHQTLIIDTREPWPHPWEIHIPEAHFMRDGLETGDIALGANRWIVVERKTVADFLGSITAGRERFEAELKRSRLMDHFAIIVEGTIMDVVENRGGLTVESIYGTVAAFSRRYCPIHFAGSERGAARLAWSILTQPVNEANRLVKAAATATKKAVKWKAGQVTGEDGKPLF
jgi:ERCC4-type nuclease